MAEEKGLNALRFAQAAIELRYEKTQRYWDESGKLIAAIEGRLPGIVCERLGPNATGWLGLFTMVAG
jgi:hypothetical protein